MIRQSKQFIIKILYILIDVCCLYLAIYLSCLARKKLIDFPLAFPYFLVDESNPFRFIFLFWILTTIFSLMPIIFIKQEGGAGGYRDMAGH